MYIQIDITFEYTAQPLNLFNSHSFFDMRLFCCFFFWEQYYFAENFGHIWNLAILA